MPNFSGNRTSFGGVSGGTSGGSGGSNRTSTSGAFGNSYNQSQRKASGGPGSGSDSKKAAADRGRLSSAGKQTEGGTREEKASYRNELMKAGKMRAYRLQGEIDSGQQPGYTPGAVPSYPDADLLTVVEKIGLPAALALAPGANLLLSGATAAKAALEGDVTKTTTLFGGDPGEQLGWAPDRSKGASFNPDDPRGTSLDEIAGQSYRADPIETPGNESGETPATAADDPYSNVMLADRRKPYTSLKKMLETML
jgi:hypothetical protein